MAKSKMKTCKHCGQPIAKSAKKCPHCGGKNKKSILMYVLIFFVLFGVVGALGGGDSEEPGDTGNIEYTIVSVAELNDALENNAAAAKDTYEDTYVEVTGILGNIDSDLSYICIDEDKWDLKGVQCFIQNEEQEEIVKTLQSGQQVTVRGKVTEVGEILAYLMDIKEIVTE